MNPVTFATRPRQRIDEAGTNRIGDTCENPNRPRRQATAISSTPYPTRHLHRRNTPGSSPAKVTRLHVYDSLEKAQATRNAPALEARKIGDKYAKFRAYVVEGFQQ
jgi:hypothetical protein